MNFSKHAKVRSKQRGVPSDNIELILRFGRRTRKPGDAWEYALGKKEKNKAVAYLKYLIQTLDKAGGQAVLVSHDQTEVITMYHLKGA